MVRTINKCRMNECIKWIKHVTLLYIVVPLESVYNLVVLLKRVCLLAVSFKRVYHLIMPLERVSLCSVVGTITLFKMPLERVSFKKLMLESVCLLVMWLERVYKIVVTFTRRSFCYRMRLPFEWMLFSNAYRTHVLFSSTVSRLQLYHLVGLLEWVRFSCAVRIHVPFCRAVSMRLPFSSAIRPWVGKLGITVFFFDYTLVNFLFWHARGE